MKNDDIMETLTAIAEQIQSFLSGVFALFLVWAFLKWLFSPIEINLRGTVHFDKRID